MLQDYFNCKRYFKIVVSGLLHVGILILSASARRVENS